MVVDTDIRDDGTRNFAGERESDEMARGERDAKDAFIGFSRIDLIDIRFSFNFNVYNKRSCNKKEVKKLLRTMDTVGYQRYSDKALIPLLVNADDLEPGCHDPDHTRAESLPLFNLKSSAVKPGKTYELVGASGQHRYNAIQTKIKDLDSCISTLSEQKNKHPEGSSIPKRILPQVKKVQDDLYNANALRQGMEYWGVRLYDNSA